jgi:phosphatidylcholine synthase
MVAVVVFATQPDFWVILGLSVVLSVTMFLRVKFVHPVRTQRWRAITLPMALAWTGLAGAAAWLDFAQPHWVTLGLIVTSVYLMVAGAAQQVIYKERL